ncbi:MAG TPA: four-carbon acid sugar kinase family protein, partial [Burkholderiales bacterium]|nr:four-carbon acid sugar kinase family protein [Burkholderiales bacterium]
HYKVCSTFDSAPEIGNIAAAVHALRPHVANRFVPIVGGQPNIGRYCTFSNLYAAAGAGGTVYRIDRHPTMSRHPVTPMHEADLRRHLGSLGLQEVAGLHAPAYGEESAALDARLDALIAAAPADVAAVLLDLTEPEQLAAIGRLIWSRAQQARLLAVGPSSVVQALAAYWRERGELPAAGNSGAPHEAARTPVFVLAGSLSPVTAGQVDAAASYTRLAIDAGRLVGGGPRYRDACIAETLQHLRAGRPVLASTAPGSASGAPAEPHAVALACADLLRHLLAQMPLARVGIAGGDTSSHAVQALDLWGLSFVRTLGPGVALTRAHSDDPALDGMELMLKGGQMGQEDLFERLAG